MDSVKIGKFLAKKRKDKKLTQEKLAEKLNVSFKSISKWECGVTIPPIDVIKSMCEELDFEPNEIFYL